MKIRINIINIWRWTLHHGEANMKSSNKMCNDIRNSFIEAFHNELLVSDLYDRLFLIITLMNLGYTCIFQKGFERCNSSIRRKMRLLFHIVHRGNTIFGFKKVKV